MVSLSCLCFTTFSLTLKHMVSLSCIFFFFSKTPLSPIKTPPLAVMHAVHAFYPQPEVCTPPGCSPLHGTHPPTAAAALTRRERAPQAASSPAARSPDAAGRNAGQKSRHGRCSGPPRRSAGRRSPVGCSGRAGTPGGHHPTSSLA